MHIDALLEFVKEHECNAAQNERSKAEGYYIIHVVYVERIQQTFPEAITEAEGRRNDED